MSKIKDLYAEVEGIDDLKPEPHKYGKEFYMAVEMEDIKRIGNQLVQKAMEWEDRDSWFAKNAEYGVGELDCGLDEIYFENFCELCEQAITELFDAYIEEQQLDVSDEFYSKVIDYASDNLANKLADLESDCVAEYKQDNKYILDEIRDRNGGCQY